MHKYKKTHLHYLHSNAFVERDIGGNIKIISFFKRLYWDKPIEFVRFYNWKPGSGNLHKKYKTYEIFNYAKLIDIIRDSCWQGRI